MFELIPYSFVLTIHIVAFMLNIGLVVIADSLGMLWIIGKKETLPEGLMRWLHKLVWVGLSLSVVTGIMLFLESDEYLLTVPAFYTKMVFVLALVVNSFLIHKHLETPLKQSFKSVDKKEKRSLLKSGVISTICWVGVVISAQFLGL